MSDVPIYRQGRRYTCIIKNVADLPDLGEGMKKTILGLSMCVIALLWIGKPHVYGQMSVASLRASLQSSNLEVVSLEGVAHLSRRHPQELGGRCGGTGFMLTDDTGSIEVTVRHANRLLAPVREGDRVHVSAQIKVLRTRDNVPYRICVEATDIQHFEP